MQKIIKIFGPPGTGKTTKLLDIVDNYLKEDGSPKRIAYLSFSTRAANEAAERACKKFGFKRAELPYFRTVHSLGYQNAGMRRDEIMQFVDYKSIADLLGIKISEFQNEEDTIYGNEIGDQAKQICELSRAKLISLEEEWKIASRKLPINFAIVEKWNNTVNEYKKIKGMYDFSDMLEKYSGSLPVDLFIVDEAQDLSKLQWRVVNEAGKHAKEIYMAGDDDQSIFNWNGADLHTFMKTGSSEDIVLPQSYRVPNKIANVAVDIVNRIKERHSKNWDPKKADGSVTSSIPLHYLKLETGNWMLLVRNTKFIRRLEQELQSRGLLYLNYTRKSQHSIYPGDSLLIQNWVKLQKGERISRESATAICKKLSSKIPMKSMMEYSMNNLPISENLKKKEWYDVFSKSFSYQKVEYIRECLRNGYKLNDEPNIIISTIHKVKGGECDNVAIVPDVSFNTYQYIDTDDEHRVWYVGVTRAKEALYLLMPESKLFYNFNVN